MGRLGGGAYQEAVVPSSPERRPSMLVIDLASEDARPTVNLERVRLRRRFQPRATDDGHREGGQALVANMGCCRPHEPDLNEALPAASRL
jgi:hypothetical protein